MIITPTHFYKTTAYIVLCTRNRKKILDNPEVFDIITSSITNICEKNGASVISIKTGVISPEGLLHYRECALRLVIDIMGTMSPGEIILEIKKDVREKIRENFPDKPNPFTRDFLITDEKNYSEEIAYEFIDSSTWRTGGGNARTQRLLAYYESLNKIT